MPFSQFFQRPVHPAVKENFNLSTAQARKKFLARDQVIKRLKQLTTLPAIGAMGWQSGFFVAQGLGFEAETQLAEIAAITGASSATFALIAAIALGYYDLKSKCQKEKTECPSFNEYLVTNWRDFCAMFFASILADSMWNIYYEKLITPLAKSWAQEGQEPSPGLRIAAMLLIFGILTTLTNETTSKFLGFLFSDSGNACLMNSIVLSLGASFVFGLLGETTQLIPGINNIASKVISLLIIGIAIATSACFTASTGTALTYVYDRCKRNTNSVNTDEEQPVLESEPSDPSLREEIVFRVMGTTRQGQQKKASSA
jgi:hypothetical protein